LSNLYEILEVPRDADAVTIKRAYKRKAQVVHPDKNGGDDTAFHQVALAYEVLIDPERRDRYDRTGDTKSEPYGQAEAMLATLFSSVIANSEYRGDLIETCRKKIAMRNSELNKEFLKNDIKLKSLTRQLKRITCSGFNIYESLVNTQIGTLTRTNEVVNKEILLLKEVGVLLDGYKDTKPEEGSAGTTWVNFEIGG
jgi:curved DNA-binding protein CbpA